MTKAAIWSLLDQNRTFMGMFFSLLKICLPFFGQNFGPIFHARNHLDSPKTNQVAKKFGPIFVKKLISDFDLTFF